MEKGHVLDQMTEMETLKLFHSLMKFVPAIRLGNFDVSNLLICYTLLDVIKPSLRLPYSLRHLQYDSRLICYFINVLYSHFKYEAYARCWHISSCSLGLFLSSLVLFGPNNPLITIHSQGNFNVLYVLLFLLLLITTKHSAAYSLPPILLSWLFEKKLFVSMWKFTLVV